MKLIKTIKGKTILIKLDSGYKFLRGFEKHIRQNLHNGVTKGEFNSASTGRKVGTFREISVMEDKLRGFFKNI